MDSIICNIIVIYNDRVKRATRETEREVISSAKDQYSIEQRRDKKRERERTRTASRATNRLPCVSCYLLTAKTKLDIASFLLKLHERPLRNSSSPARESEPLVDRRPTDGPWWLRSGTGRTVAKEERVGHAGPPASGGHATPSWQVPKGIRRRSWTRSVQSFPLTVCYLCLSVGG